MSDPGVSELSLQDAQSLFEAGRFAEASRILHDMLRTDPRQFEALKLLGLIYFHSGQFDRAQYLLGEALLLDPFYIDGLVLRGIAFLRLQLR